MMNYLGEEYVRNMYVKKNINKIEINLEDI
jgi:hypothetical protein